MLRGADCRFTLRLADVKSVPFLFFLLPLSSLDAQFCVSLLSLPLLCTFFSPLRVSATCYCLRCFVAPLILTHSFSKHSPKSPFELERKTTETLARRLVPLGAHALATLNVFPAPARSAGCRFCLFSRCGSWRACLGLEFKVEFRLASGLRNDEDEVKPA
jgi:hypothetical protein